MCAGRVLQADSELPNVPPAGGKAAEWRAFLRRVKATDLFFDLAIADQSRLHTARRTGGAPPSPLKLPERRTRPWRMTRNDVKRCATMPVLQARRRDAPTPSSRARGGSRGGKRDRSRKISVPSLKVFAACQSLPNPSITKRTGCGPGR
jgi:hypothetical protein